MFSIGKLLDFLLEKKHIEIKPDFSDTNKRIKGFSSLLNPSNDSLCWTKKTLSTDDIPHCVALLCLPSQESNNKIQTKLIHVRDPRKAFGDVIDKFYSSPVSIGISNSAEIHPTAKIGKNVYVGSGAVIGENCVVGNNTRIDANVTLYDGVRIGINCHLYSGATIGSDGFGYFLDENKKYKKIQHIGGVTIGNNVDIGTNSCIDRGVLDDTVIEDNVKIDNLVQIAHNVQIGSNTIIIAGAVISGSVILGKNCWISPGAVIKNGVNLKDEVQVGMNSVVYRSSPESNVCLVGDPAKKIKKYEAK